MSFTIASRPVLCLFTAFTSVAVVTATVAAQSTQPMSTTQPTTAAAKPNFPSVLPGKGLAHHDFFYAGEAKTQDMFIVRGGKVAWEHHGKDTRGEISDAVLMSNGNVLFAHQYGITLLAPDQRVLWKLDAPENTEIHTAQPIGLDRIVYVRNGIPAKVFVVNIKTDQVEREFEIPVKNPNGIHGHFRHARLTPAGTLLVAHMDMGRVCEYDEHGKELWAADVPGVWAATPLDNGNVLVTANRAVREMTRAKETVWEFTATDLGGYKVNQFQIALRLPNGNTLVNNWVNQWSGPIDRATVAAQAWEVTPAKQVVWALRSWDPPADLGPATTIQLLDTPAVPEDVRFGSFK